jgi:hypothetical protein
MGCQVRLSFDDEVELVYRDAEGTPRILLQVAALAGPPPGLELEASVDPVRTDDGFAPAARLYCGREP